MSALFFSTDFSSSNPADAAANLRVAVEVIEMYRTVAITVFHHNYVRHFTAGDSCFRDAELLNHRQGWLLLGHDDSTRIDEAKQTIQYHFHFSFASSYWPDRDHGNFFRLGATKISRAIETFFYMRSYLDGQSSRHLTTNLNVPVGTFHCYPAHLLWANWGT